MFYKFKICLEEFCFKILFFVQLQLKILCFKFQPCKIDINSSSIIF